MRNSLVILKNVFLDILEGRKAAGCEEPCSLRGPHGKCVQHFNPFLLKFRAEIFFPLILCEILLCLACVRADYKFLARCRLRVINARFLP